MSGTWTIKRLLEWTTEFLSKKGIEKAWLDADLLLAHALGWKRIDLRTRYDEEAPEDARTRYRELVKERAEGCPVAYLTGRKEFFLLDFEVNRGVLIPRPDTEQLLSECLRLIKGIAAPNVLDVGTGSGCLAVGIVKQHRSATVTAIDISPEALAVATRNAAKHDVADRILFLEGDLFAPLVEGQFFDAVVSNPPYIAHDVIATLARDVKDYEPTIALDGGVDGLEVFSRFVEGARRHLKPGGRLLCEIGWDQEAAARAKIEALGCYELARTVHDQAGHPRVLIAQWKP